MLKFPAWKNAWVFMMGVIQFCGSSASPVLNRILKMQNLVLGDVYGSIFAMECGFSSPLNAHWVHSHCMQWLSTGDAEEPQKRIKSKWRKQKCQCTCTGFIGNC